MTGRDQEDLMEFPENSKVSTEKQFTWDEVRTLLDKEAMRRAEYIARLLLRLSSLYGEEVFEIAKREIYQIGFEKGQGRAKSLIKEGRENNLSNLAGLVSHEIAQLYLGNSVTVDDERMTVIENYCPLPRKWKEMGLDDGQIIELCLIFDQVDKGMVEGYNNSFEASLTGCHGLHEKGLCQMVICRKEQYSK
jgi:hypothetical protein